MYNAVRLPSSGKKYAASGGEFNRSMQHEPRMEVSWCKVFARA